VMYDVYGADRRDLQRRVINTKHTVTSYLFAQRRTGQHLSRTAGYQPEPSV